MSVRTLKRSIIRSQSENTKDFRVKWKEFHDKEMETRHLVDTNKKAQYHYDNGKHLISAWQRMKEYIQQMKNKKSEDQVNIQTDE